MAPKQLCLSLALLSPINMAWLDFHLPEHETMLVHVNAACAS
jgi:hypothetical protein